MNESHLSISGDIRNDPSRHVGLISHDQLVDTRDIETTRHIGSELLSDYPLSRPRSRDRGQSAGRNEMG
jgi:hypothetical protein